MYMRLAEAVKDGVRQGLLTAGSRMPAERMLSAALAVSRTTVVAAYDELRREGWLESRHGSGTWICRRSPVVSAARDLAQARVLAESPLFAAFQGNDETIDLSIGTPYPLTGLSTDPYQLPPDEMAALLENRHYLPLGLPSLRLAVAERFTQRGLPTLPTQILITSGAQQALALCAALFLRRGDTAAVEDPTYFGALDAFRVAEARLASIPPVALATSQMLLKDRLVASSARLAYIVPTFHNPLGCTVSPPAREAFAGIVAALDIPTIEDETLADMRMEAGDFVPLASYARDAQILTVGSLSKLFWGGLRVGWVRGPEATINALARLKTAQDLGGSRWMQTVAVRCLGMMDEAIARRKAQLLTRRDFLLERLRDSLPDWTFVVPAGGVFLWTRMPSGNARTLAQIALRHGLMLMPGSALSASHAHEDCLRLSFLLEEDQIDLGVQRLQAAWQESANSTAPASILSDGLRTEPALV